MKNPSHKTVAKIIEDMMAVSFSRSADGDGSLCDSNCRHWSLCYAAKLEKMPTRASIRKMLESRTDRAMEILEATIKWMPRDFAWMRWSVFGSVPSKKQMGAKWKQWAKLFRKANEQALESNADVHLPVESQEKADQYREVLHGLPIVVRRSDQSETIGGLLQSNDHRSWVAGTVRWRYSAAQKAENDRLADLAVKTIRDNGETAIKCPYAKNQNLKCGICRACPNNKVKVVVYTAH